MENLNKTLIPLWLQLSELYKTLSKFGMNFYCELFEPRFIKENSDINNFADFNHVMICIDYWGVDYNTWSPNIYKFMIIVS